MTSVHGSTFPGLPQVHSKARAISPIVPEQFTMLDDETVSGMARPTRSENIQFLHQRGITLLVSLTETSLSQDLFADPTIRNVHLPIPDNMPPTEEQAREFLNIASQEIQLNHRIAVHCEHGIGRTGTMLALWLVYHNKMTPAQAIHLLRQKGYELHANQVAFVHTFFQPPAELLAASKSLSVAVPTVQPSPMDVDEPPAPVLRQRDDAAAAEEPVILDIEVADGSVMPVEKVLPGVIGNKAANLVFLRDHIPSLPSTLVERGYTIAVPEFASITTEEARRFLQRQHLDLERRWRIVEQSSQEAVPELAAPGGRLEQMSQAIQHLGKRKSRSTIGFPHRKQRKTSSALGQDVLDFLNTSQATQWRLMVRSSGKEDSDQFSNAGGNETVANVSPYFYDIKKAADFVISSYLAPKSIMQRSQAGEDITVERPYIPVLLQRMIGEELNGAHDSAQIPVGCVVYSQEPFGNTPGVTLIQASFGHNEGVVNSTVATDSFYVDPSGSVRSTVKKKTQRIIPTFDGEKYKLEFTPNPEELQTAPALSSDEALAIKQVADAIQAWYGKPMDIELVFERHTKTIYLVQARPLKVVRSLTPRYIRSPNPENVIHGTTVNPDNCSVRRITSDKQLIIADTLADALNIFNNPRCDTKQIQAVIVRGDAEATSHAAAIFRAAEKPILILDNIELLREWLREDHPLVHIDVQQEIVTRKEQEILDGWLTHPMPTAMMVMDTPVHPLPFPITEQCAQFTDRQLIDLLKDLPVDQQTNPSKEAILGSLAARIQKKIDEYRIHSTRETQAITQDVCEKLDLTYRYLTNVISIIHSKALSFPPRTIERLYYLKALESIFSQPDSHSVIGALSVANLKAQYASYAEFISGSEQPLSRTLLKNVEMIDIAQRGATIALSPAIERNWSLFVSGVAAGSHRVPENQTLFIEMITTLTRLGAMPAWLNVAFNREWNRHRNDSMAQRVHKTFKALYADYLRNRDFLERLTAINNSLDAITVSDWENPARFDKLLESFNANILQLFKSPEFIALLLAGKNEFFKNIVALPLMSKLIDTFDDRFLKTFKGSAQYRGQERKHVANFRKAVAVYFSILEAWAPLIENANPEIAAKGYNIQSIPEYIASIKQWFEANDSDDPVQLLPSPDFSVESQTYPNYVKNTKFVLKARRLEDFFTLTHQNINCIINRLMSQIGLNTVDTPPFFKTVEDKVKQVLPPSGGDGPGWRYWNKMTLIGIKLSGNSITYTYNLPLKVHGETFDITYDKSTGSVNLMVNVVTDDPRSEHLDMESALPLLSAMTGIPLKGTSRITDNEMSFTLKIDPATDQTHLVDLITFVNASTYSETSKDEQFDGVPDAIIKLANTFALEKTPAALSSIQTLANGTAHPCTLHYFIIKSLIDGGKISRNAPLVRMAVRQALTKFPPDYKTVAQKWNDLLIDPDDSE